MANSAQKDQNYVPTLTAVLNADGATISTVLADPSNHQLNVSNGTSGADNGPYVALRDGNGFPTLLATSSVDGVTPVVVYCDSNGNLLVNSN